MRRFYYITYLVLFLFVMPVFGQNEPVPARKPLRYWVERLSHEDPKVRKRAVEFLNSESEANGLWEVYVPDSKYRKKIEAFRKEVKPLIPELLKVLKSTDETVGETSAEENVVMAAAGVLMILGPEAEAASPELERIVFNKKAGYMTRMFGFHALLFVTPEEKPIGPILLKYLNSMPKETMLKLFGEDQDTTNDDKGNLSVDSLVETSIALSIPMYTNLLMSSGHSKCEVPYLVKIATGDYTPTIRKLAIGTLGSLTFEAKSSVPALRKLLKDRDRNIGHWAASSLIQIEPDPKLVPVIVESLELKGKEREEFEREMREQFKQQEQERRSWREVVSDDDLTKFVEQLKYGNGFLRRQAIHYLGLIGPGAKSVVPELRKFLKDPDEDTRRMAAEALKQIESEAVNSSGKN